MDGQTGRLDSFISCMYECFVCICICSMFFQVPEEAEGIRFPEIGLQMAVNSIQC